MVDGPIPVNYPFEWVAGPTPKVAPVARRQPDLRRLSPYRQAVDAFLFARCHMPVMGRALDIGGGRQRGVWRRDSTYCSWSVLDIDGEAETGEDFVVRNVEHGLPWPSGDFHLVTAIDVLYMVRHDTLPYVWSEIARVLHPTGVFVAVLPFMRQASEDTDEARWTPAALKRDLHMVGLTAEIVPLGGWWSLLVSLLYDGSAISRPMLRRLAPVARWRDARLSSRWALGYGIVASRQ